MYRVATTTYMNCLFRHFASHFLVWLVHLNVCLPTGAVGKLAILGLDREESGTTVKG